MTQRMLSMQTCRVQLPRSAGSTREVLVHRVANTMVNLTHDKSATAFLCVATNYVIIRPGTPRILTEPGWQHCLSRETPLCSHTTQALHRSVQTITTFVHPLGLYEPLVNAPFCNRLPRGTLGCQSSQSPRLPGHLHRVVCALVEGKRDFHSPRFRPHLHHILIKRLLSSNTSSASSRVNTLCDQHASACPVLSTMSIISWIHNPSLE